jgi:hypothetical protein
MSAIRKFLTATRVIVWLLALSSPGLGATYAAEPETVAGPTASGDTPAEAQMTGKEPGTPVAANAPGERVVDRLKLDTTAITGNRELPKVMSIVPWKPAEAPEGPERPMGSLIEELLAPVDRDEFRREITYYRDLTSQSNPSDAQAAGRPVVAVEPERNRPNPSSPPGASIP